MWMLNSAIFPLSFVVIDFDEVRMPYDLMILLLTYWIREVVCMTPAQGNVLNGSFDASMVEANS